MAGRKRVPQCLVPAGCALLDQAFPVSAVLDGRKKVELGQVGHCQREGTVLVKPECRALAFRVSLQCIVADDGALFGQDCAFPAGAHRHVGVLLVAGDQGDLSFQVADRGHDFVNLALAVGGLPQWQEDDGDRLLLFRGQHVPVPVAFRIGYLFKWLECGQRFGFCFSCFLGLLLLLVLDVDLGLESHHFAGKVADHRLVHRKFGFLVSGRGGEEAVLVAQSGDLALQLHDDRILLGDLVLLALDGLLLAGNQHLVGVLGRGLRVDFLVPGLSGGGRLLGDGG